MIIVGFDPGLQKTGWGLISSLHNHLTYIASGAIATKPSQPLASRLLTLQTEIYTLLSAHTPDAAAIEEIFVGKSHKSALLLAHARGTILTSLASHHLLCQPYAPRHIKKAISGYGNADKHQVTFMVKRLLPRADISSHDEADALAIAICHAHHLSFSSHIPPSKDTHS